MSEAQMIFELLNQKVMENLVLTLQDFNKVFQVDCDVNGSSIGGVLSQEGRTIDYFSDKMNDAWRRYLVYDQVLYAIIQAVNKWIKYLLVNEFVLYNNHQAI